MIRPDDSTIPPVQEQQIGSLALQALQLSSGLGHFPTPVDDVAAALGVRLADEDVFSEDFIARFRGADRPALKRAISKVLGVLDARERIAYVDRHVLGVKQRFLSLHEIGHAFLPWQRGIYEVIEDCDETLTSELADLFDRQASLFASDVLFQGDAFAKETADLPCTISTPLGVTAKYGASAYASIRRYVSTHSRPCAVAVFDRVSTEGFGGVELRRAIQSKGFSRQFGAVRWPERVSSTDDWGILIPVGCRIGKTREWFLRDRRGGLRECLVETFDSTYNVFLLFWVVD